MELINVSTQNEMDLYPELEKLQLFASARGTEVPSLTKQVALGSFPNGNRYLSLRDEYGPLFSIEDFSDLYS